MRVLAVLIRMKAHVVNEGRLIINPLCRHFRFHSLAFILICPLQVHDVLKLGISGKQYLQSIYDSFAIVTFINCAGTQRSFQYYCHRQYQDLNIYKIHKHINT